MVKTFTNEQIDDALQFRLNRIDKPRNYFVKEIREREIMSKKHGKYIAAFDYVDQTLPVLSVASSVVSINSLLMLMLCLL